jgi:hypothetical protein
VVERSTRRNESHLSEPTVNTIVTAGSSFCRYYIQRGTQLENPVLYEQCSARFLLDPYLLGLVETLQSELPEFKIL